MSNMYFPDDTLKQLDARETVKMTKGHQQRSCVVCGLPVVDDKAESINIGGGLEVLTHRACMAELTEAMEPKSIVIPVKQPSVTPVRKATVATPTSDKDRLKERIRFEFTKLLMQHGLIHQTRTPV